MSVLLRQPDCPQGVRASHVRIKAGDLPVADGEDSSETTPNLLRAPFTASAVVVEEKDAGDLGIEAIPDVTDGGGNTFAFARLPVRTASCARTSMPSSPLFTARLYQTSIAVAAVSIKMPSVMFLRYPIELGKTLNTDPDSVVNC